MTEVRGHRPVRWRGLRLPGPGYFAHGIDSVCRALRTRNRDRPAPRSAERQGKRHRLSVPLRTRHDRITPGAEYWLLGAFTPVGEGLTRLKCVWLRSRQPSRSTRPGTSDNTRVHRNAVVENAILDKDVAVLAGATVGGGQGARPRPRIRSVHRRTSRASSRSSNSTTASRSPCSHMTLAMPSQQRTDTDLPARGETSASSHSAWPARAAPQEASSRNRNWRKCPVSAVLITELGSSG